jgi:hypothetical protein
LLGVYVMEMEIFIFMSAIQRSKKQETTAPPAGKRLQIQQK